MGKAFATNEGVHGCDGCCIKQSEADEDRELANEYNRGM